MHPFLKNHKRRGLSFVEVLSSLIIVSMLTVIVLASFSIITSNTKDSLAYSRLKFCGTNLIETMQRDVELSAKGEGSPIDTIDYSDYSGEDGVIIEVSPPKIVGCVSGKDLYFVEIKLTDVATHNIVRSSFLLREGCVAHAL